MRERNTRSLLKIGLGATLALLAAASRPAGAQSTVQFDGTDWTRDRGNATQYRNGLGNTVSISAFINELVGNTVVSDYPSPWNPGYLEFYTDHGFTTPDPNHQFTNPGAAARRFVWPATQDLNQLSPSGQPISAVTVDNQDLTGLDPYPNPDAFENGANPYTAPYLVPIIPGDTTIARVQPLPLTSAPQQQVTAATSQYAPYPSPTGNFNVETNGNVFVNMNAQMFYPQAQLTPAARWNLPAPNVTDTTDNYRAPGQGFSFNVDPTKPYNYDYYYVVDTGTRYSTFPVQRTTGGASAATATEIASMPNAPANVYSAIHNALVTDWSAGNPVSVWTSGGSGIYDPTTGTYDARVPVQAAATHLQNGQTVSDFRYYPYNMQPGHYGVDIYSPGDGTFIDNTGYAHANVQRAFCRVSWYRTLNTNGTFNWGNNTAGAGGINDPTNSRIFVVDLEQNGWIHLQGGGLGPATFTWDGDPRDQLVVTLYTLTPENPADPYYVGEAPLITADAVRFVPQQMPSYLTQRGNTGGITAQTPLIQPAPNLTRYDLASTTGGTPNDVTPVWTISGYGRILSSVNGTVKLANAQSVITNTTNKTTVVPVTFVAREEGRAEYDLANAPLRSALDPTRPVNTDNTSASYNPPAPDPTAISTEPVFYALDNRNEDTLDRNVPNNPVPTGTTNSANNPLSTPVFITSAQKVLWRYEGVPDSENSVVSSPGPNGTANATGLLTGVICRDGNVRTMLYWCTTSQDGTIGHVYALDPIGVADTQVVDTNVYNVVYVNTSANNNFPNYVPEVTNSTVAVDTELTNNPRVTNAYWVYPSYRPLLGSEPAGAPTVYQDPNFTLPPGFTRNGYPLPPVNDFAEPYLHYDGDIVQGNTGLYVPSDTLVQMGGVQGSPFIVTNPDVLGGLAGGEAPQLLVVPSIDGHVYAFDAGGRLDFSPYGTPVTMTNGTTFLAAGTTERMWTWPHLGADTFHDTTVSGIGANGNWAQANSYSNDPAIGGIYSSPAYDTSAGNNAPALVPSLDGHLYAIQLNGDQRNPQRTLGQSPYLNREIWQYPGVNTSLQAAVSTPTIFKGNVYFTCNGRIYAVSENTSNTSPVAPLTWVYPPSANPPYANPNDPNTQPLVPGFNGTAPTVVDSTFIVQSPYKAGLGITNPLANIDMVYAVQGNGTVYGLSAAGGANLPIGYLNTNGAVVNGVVTGQTPLGSNVRSNGMGSLLTSMPGYDTITQNVNNTEFGTTSTLLTGTDDNPSLVFADDDGVMNGFGMIPINDQSGNNTYVLPILYQNYDSFVSRSAATAEVGGDHYDLNQQNTVTTTTPSPAPAINQNNVSYTYDNVADEINTAAPANNTSGANPAGAGMWYEGDEGGQLRGYGNGVGSLFYGVGSTVGPYEPTPPNPGAGDVTIDVRSVDFYAQTDWNAFALTTPTGAETPGKIYQSGGTTTPASHYAAPITTPLNNPNNTTGQGAVAVDWGDYLYVAAWGVYHAQLPATSAGGTGSNAPPAITVTFTVSQPYAPSKTYTAVVPAVTPPKVPTPAQMAYWPDDAGITSGEAALLSIQGVDITGNFTSGDTSGVHMLTGPTEGVFPWVAKIRILVRPEGSATFIPGAMNYAVTARATIRQNMNVNGQTFDATGIGGPMRAGQYNWQGKTSSPFGANPNDRGSYSPTNPNGTGLARQIYFTNPIGITVAYNNFGDGPTTSVNTIGWMPAVSQIESNLTDLQEVLGNGNLLVNPNGALSNSVGPYKQLYMPVGMVQDGSASSPNYAIDANGNAINALDIMDRSNLAANAGTALQVKIVPDPIHWYGGASSVMNPLPWETLPNDVTGSADYPPIPPTNVSVLVGNAQALNTAATLTAPQYPNGTSNTSTRTPQPTPTQLQVNVPKYQPANVNTGQVTIGGVTYGESFLDLNGQANDPLYGHGPLVTSTGVPGALNARSFPSEGYIGTFNIQAVVPASGQAGFGSNGRPQPGLPLTGQAYGATGRTTNRQFSAGMSVPPHTAMRVVESTVDLGPMPQGSGYTAKTGNSTPPYYTGLFAPSMPGNITAWDPQNATGGQSFFQPFTVVSDSNINLVDVRAATLTGISTSSPQIGLPSLADYPPANWDASARIISDEVNNLSSQSIFGLPFLNPGQAAAEGNIGFVTSFDHYGTTSTGNNPAVKVNPLWPITNPYVTSSGISNAGLATTGLNPWANSTQPVPTIHKPLPGDAQGTQATIPDKPHTQDPVDTTTYFPTKVGVAIPLGQPSGTYGGPLYVYEDNTPFQWRNWIASSQGIQTNDASLGVNHDGVLNVTASGAPIEPHTDPTMNVRLTVTEARLTNGTTPGNAPMVDLGNFGSVNMQPAVIRPVISGGTSGANSANMFLYWTRSVPSSPNAPYQIAYSELPGTFTATSNTTALGDFGFAVGNQGNSNQWWSTPSVFPALANLGNLFPQNGTAASPGLPGNIAPDTARFATPAAVQAVNVSNSADTESWLFWQGVVNKIGAITASSQGVQQTDSRTFYVSLNGNTVGVPDPNAQIMSILNDPALTKLSPKPIVLKGLNGAAKITYLFWFSGNTGHTSIYYNVNTDPNMAPANWSKDTQLPAPAATSWQSDPVPVYRRVPTANGMVDAIDLVFTGVLRNHTNQEALLARYQINEGQFAGMPLGALVPMQLPPVALEQLSRVGATNTFMSRDAGWLLRSTAANNADNDPIGLVVLHADGTTTTLLTFSSARGTLDPASGLVYFPSSMGGQFVVDPNAGTISFPNVPPSRNDRLLAYYTPQVMRLSVSRDSDNSLLAGNNLPVQPRSAVSTSGNTTNPTAFLERTANPRTSLQSPVVVFAANGQAVNTAPQVDRFWTFYRKTDTTANGGANVNGIYLKPMRLVARLPKPVALTTPNANGIQQITGLTVTGAQGPYEVDWVRGRVYFTEVDEGNTVTISYTASDGSTPSGSYLVAWGDELSEVSPNGQFPVPDQSSPEQKMLLHTSVNEGQVTAYKDPFSDKVWVFWSSTQNGRSDLYYQTIAPQLYPTTPNR